MTPSEPFITLTKGTADWLPSDQARLFEIESAILHRFSLAGYDRISTPVLEPVELHERKSGAGIVGKLFELPGRVCLRPELTAGIVRAYTAAQPAPSLPWRVFHAGPAFRKESPGQADRLREFRQVGVERLGDSGTFADAELIELAWSSARLSGVAGATLRLGHVGLTLEMLGRSGLPPTAQAALVEMLSEAAAEGGDVGSLGRGLDHFAEWLRQASGDEIPLPIEENDDGGVDRLFRTLVPVINGRRSASEIVQRLRRKWDLGHSWLASLDRVRDQTRALADLKGSPKDVLGRLARDFEALAPDSVAALRDLVQALEDQGVPADRIELDLGFSRGIGFYSQVVFEVIAPTPTGPVEVCGGGRYDGLARVLGSDRDDRGAGFAFGMERLDTVLRTKGPRGEGEFWDKNPSYLVVAASPAQWKKAAEWARSIRCLEYPAILEMNWQGREMLERATVLGSTHIVYVAASEEESYLARLEAPGQVSHREKIEDFWGFQLLLDKQEKP